MLENVPSLPAAGATLERLLEIALAEPADPGNLGQLVETMRLDPASAVELLRAAPRVEPRSGFALDLARAARDVSPAKLTLLACTAREAPADEELSGSGALRRRALAVACAARALASSRGSELVESAYCAGLLSEIGRLALAAERPAESAELRARVIGQDLQRLAELETELFGVTHEDVGMALAEAWSLPEELRDVLAFSQRSAEQLERDAPREARELIGIVRAALYVASVAGFPAVDGLRSEPASDDVAALLQGVDLDSLAERVAAETAFAAAPLDARARDASERAHLFRRARARLARRVFDAELRLRVSEAVNAVLQDGLQRLGDGDPLPGLLYRTLECMGFRRIAQLESDSDARTLTIKRALALGGVERLSEGAWVPFPADSRAFGVPTVVRRDGGGSESQLLLELFGSASCVIAPLSISETNRTYLCADRGPLGMCGVEGEEKSLGIIADQARLLLDYQALTREKERMATQDPLTGAATRRRLMDRLDALVVQSHQTRLPLALLIMDLDHFKRFNDTLGHQAGDRLLQDLVRVLGSQVRKGDLVARYGGEEFVVVLPGANLEGAARSGEKVREAVFAYGREHAHDYGGLAISISIGAAALAGGESSTALIGRADAALYRAKNNGRNRVELAS